MKRHLHQERLRQASQNNGSVSRSSEHQESLCQASQNNGSVSISSETMLRRGHDVSSSSGHGRARKRGRMIDYSDAHPALTRARDEGTSRTTSLDSSSSTSDDENNPLYGPAIKNVRGKTIAADIWGWPESRSEVVYVTENNGIVGWRRSNVCTFITSIGNACNRMLMVVRENENDPNSNLIPIIWSNRRLNRYKEIAHKEITRRFIFIWEETEGLRVPARKEVSVCHLKSPDFEEKSKRNKRNQSKQQYSHRQGSQSSKQWAFLQKQKNGHVPDRVEMLEHAYVRNDGTAVSGVAQVRMDCMRARMDELVAEFIQTGRDLTDRVRWPIADRAIQDVLGPEHHGSVRCLSTLMTPTRYFDVHHPYVGQRSECAHDFEQPLHKKHDPPVQRHDVSSSSVASPREVYVPEPPQHDPPPSLQSQLSQQLQPPQQSQPSMLFYYCGTPQQTGFTPWGYYRPPLCPQQQQYPFSSNGALIDPVGPFFGPHMSQYSMMPESYMSQLMASHQIPPAAATHDLSNQEID